MTSKRMFWTLASVLTLLLVTAAVGLAGEQDKGKKERKVHAVVALSGQAWLGVHISDVTAEKAQELKLPGEYGVVIEEVEEESPAAKAGLKADDVLLSYAGERVRSTRQLRRLVGETPPGRTVSVELSRSGQTRTVQVTPEERHARFEMPEIHVPEMHVPEFRLPKFEMRAHPGVEVLVWGGRPRLGVSVEELTPQLGEYFGVEGGKGLLVSEVVADSPAAKAGLKAGDVIVRVDGEEVGSYRGLRQKVRREREDNKLTLTFVRDRREQTVTVQLEEKERRTPGRIAHVCRSEEGEWACQTEEWEQEMEEWQNHLNEMEEQLEQNLRQKGQELEKKFRLAEKQVKEYLNSEEFQGRMRDLEGKLRRLGEEIERAVTVVI